MEKTYEVIGILPLEFTNGQQAETGEQFVRDFAKTTGEHHEQFLIMTGHIRIVHTNEEVAETQTEEVVAAAETEKAEEEHNQTKQDVAAANLRAAAAHDAAEAPAELQKQKQRRNVDKLVARDSVEVIEHKVEG